MDLSNFTNKVSAAFDKGMSDFIPAREAIHSKAKEVITEKAQSKKIEDFER